MMSTDAERMLWGRGLSWWCQEVPCREQQQQQARISHAKQAVKELKKGLSH